MRKTQQQRLDDFPFRDEPGYIGAFTREQAAGAIPNGLPVIKGAGEAGDGTPEGTPGVVLGSFRHPAVMDGLICYFIEWKNRPRVACAVVEWKIKPA